ncbi:hypothetical protein [Paraburkholderia acidipaludis]|nr:hypothetical protein [Paraburkholderia acidipaludis]
MRLRSGFLVAAVVGCGRLAWVDHLELVLRALVAHLVEPKFVLECL